MHRFQLYPIFITVFTLLVSGCADKQEDQEEPPAYPVVEIPRKSITAYTTFPARIEGTVNVEIRPKITGFIEEIFVDEGQTVARGERLFKLEARSLQGEVDAAASAIEVARANVATAQVEVDKLIPLVEEDIISEVQLESAKANLAAARSQLSQSRNSYNSLKENIDYQFVVSAVDGIVGSIPYRQGTLVGTEQAMPLTTVSEIDSVFVYFSMNEKDYFQFLDDAEGNTLTEKINYFPEILLMLANNTEYPFKGRIQTTTGQIDAQTGTVSFRAIFPNPNKLLNAGNSGNVKIPRELEDVLLIPAQATMEEQSKRYVFRLDEGDTVRRTNVQVRENIENLMVIDKGLEASDRIVTSGMNQLQDKMKIKPETVAFDSVAQGVEQVF